MASTDLLTSAERTTTGRRSRPKRPPQPGLSRDTRIAWGLALALIARKTLLLRRRDAGDYAAIDQFAALEIGLVGLACLFLVTRPHLPRLLQAVRSTSLHWLLVFYALCMASAFWSTQPAYSLFQAVEVTSQTLLVLLAMTPCRRFSEAEDRTLQFVAIATVMGALVTVRLYGITLSLQHWHTNTYTASAAMLLCYTVAEWLRAEGQRARTLRLYAMFAAGMLCLGTSAASFLSALGGLGVAALVVGGKRWPLVLLLSALILGAALSPDTATDLLFPGKTDYQLSTLHGRTHLWTHFVEFVEESPWIGHGFAMGAKLGGVNATNTHNSLFSVLLGTGAVGVFLVGVAALCLAREISKNNKYRRSGSAGAACALAAGLANSMSIGFLGEAWREITLAFTVFLTLHVLTFTRAGVRCTRHE